MIEKKEVIGDKVFHYLKEQLDLSGKTLANYINRISLDDGRVYSFVPENTSNELLYRFNSGGLYKIDKSLFKKSPILVPVQNDARPFMINFLHEYFNQNEQHCCIFENPVNSPTDPYILNSKFKFVHIHDEMFHFFNKKNYHIEEFRKTFILNEGYYFLCCLSSIKSDEHLRFLSGEEIEPALLKHVVDFINAFIVGAYDGEGYLMWINNHSK